jgi:SAM-dependent methyltransferase
MQPHSHAHDAQLHEHLDLDVEVLHDYWSAALDWVTGATAAPARVVDLGAGPGNGTMGLARRLPQAEIVAVDIEPESLARLTAKATAHGLAARIRTVAADLDQGWPDLGEVDLTWASMSLHHLSDPTRTLREAHAATRPGGLIAVAELAEDLRFLPEGFGAGLEDRVLDVLRAARAEDLPTLGSEWAPRLTDAGWTVVEERDFAIDLNPPRHPKARRYAEIRFGRLAHGLADRLGPDDRATLSALVGGESPLLDTTDLHIRGTRTITLARRS